MRQTPIELTYTVPAGLRRRALRLADAGVENGAVRRIAGFGWFLLVLLVAFGLVLALQTSYPGLPALIIIAVFLAGHLMAFLEWKLSDLRRGRAWTRQWSRADQASTTLTADPHGLKFVSNDGGAYLSWRAVDQILPLDGGLLLRTSTGTVIIPLLGLPAGETREGILEAFDSWRAAQ